MKKALPTLLFFFFISAAFSQTTTVKGVVKDHANNTTMPGATVLLLHIADSSFYKFGSSNQNGEFILLHAEKGDYTLQVSFIGYKTFYTPLKIDGSQQEITVDDVLLSSKSEEIKTVEIQDEMIPVQIKGDTIEYNADAFKTNPESNVSDLLKKLPGMEVDKNGTVKAQGEEVQKVLVDGKEFFGNDTKLATENLPADMVKKVQVYDDQSDLSKITGIDDGDRTKTINLKLKKDRKKGLFGTVEGGGGIDDDVNAMYDNKFNINKFKEDMQISTLGMLNNTNKQGFSNRDYINFVGGGQNLGGNFRNLNNNSNGVPISSGSSNDGLTQTLAGGINLNYDFTPTITFSGNYFYNQLDKDVQSISNKQYLTGNDTTNYKALENALENQLSRNHRLNIKYVQNIDSSQTLTLTGNLIYADSKNVNNNTNDNINNTGTYISRSKADNNYLGDYYSGTGDLVYGKRFRKKGRSFVLNLTASGSNNNKDYHILNDNNFFFADTTTQQFQSEVSSDLNYQGKIAYTEPIAPSTYLELRYLHSNYQTDYDKRFFDINPTNNNETYNGNLSLIYDNTYAFDQYGLGIQLNKGNSNITTGVDFQQSTLTGKIESRNTSIENNNLFILPNFKWNYNPGKTAKLTLNYNTNAQQPTIEQLQPTIDNSNPLYLYQGNPDLEPEYNHVARLRYFMFNQFNFTNIFAMLSGNYTTNKITNAQSFDSLLIQTTQPVNVDYDYTISGYFYYGTPIRPIKTKINIGYNANYNKSIAFINAIKNNVDRITHTIDVSVENRNKDIVDAKTGARVTLNNTEYSLNSSLNQNFISTQYYTDLYIDFLKQWSFYTGLEYTVYNGDNFTDNPDIPIWKAHLSRRFLKGNKGLIKFSAFDILNQNIGINRTSQFNYIEDQRINSLGRYYMLSLSYKITRFGGKKKKDPK